MASGILRRTIFIGKGADGYHRESDWASVVTQCGSMMETRMRNRMMDPGAQEFDWTDMMNRIDIVRAFDPSGPSWGENTIGGDLVPVTGY